MEYNFVKWNTLVYYGRGKNMFQKILVLNYKKYSKWIKISCSCTTPYPTPRHNIIRIKTPTDYYPFRSRRRRAKSGYIVAMYYGAYLCTKESDFVLRGKLISRQNVDENKN